MVSLWKAVTLASNDHMLITIGRVFLGVLLLLSMLLYGAVYINNTMFNSHTIYSFGTFLAVLVPAIWCFLSLDSVC